MVDLLPEDHEDETEDGPPVWIAVWITCGLMLWAAIGFAPRCCSNPRIQTTENPRWYAGCLSTGIAMW